VQVDVFFSALLYTRVSPRVRSNANANLRRYFAVDVLRIDDEERIDNAVRIDDESGLSLAPEEVKAVMRSAISGFD
jgi:hypothetical protein